MYEPYPDQYNNGYDNSYGNNYPLKLGAEESRKDDYTKGSYYVLRPDGVLQTVDYYVNGYSGFVANVNEEPQNVHYNNNDYNKNAPYSDKKY